MQRRDAPRTHRGRLHCTPPAHLLLLAHPLFLLPLVAGVITLFEFCHHVFPDLDVERLAKEGLIDLDTHGTPRLLSDAESNSAKSKRSKRKTGKDDAEVGTPPRRPPPARPAPPPALVTRPAHPRRLFTSVGGCGLGGVAGDKNAVQGGAGGRRRDRARDGPWCERHQQRDVEPPRAVQLGQR